MDNLGTTEDTRTPEQRLYFEYHCEESSKSSDAELWYRSHQEVTILGMAPNDGSDVKTYGERCEQGTPLVYHIRFSDGFTGDALEDELLDSPTEYFRPDPPKQRSRTMRQQTTTRTENLNYGKDGTIELTEQPLPWQQMGLSYTASGYGTKIPTRYVVNYAGRKRRVYCTIYSNVGTHWFLHKGKRMIVG